MIGRPRTKPIKTWLVVIRAGNHHGATHVTGFLTCDYCSGVAMSQADFAREVGVPAGAVSAFLHRKAVRPDHARRIRDAVLRVDE